MYSHSRQLLLTPSVQSVTASLRSQTCLPPATTRFLLSLSMSSLYACRTAQTSQKSQAQQTQNPSVPWATSLHRVNKCPCLLHFLFTYPFTNCANFGCAPHIKLNLIPLCAVEVGPGEANRR